METIKVIKMRKLKIDLDFKKIVLYFLMTLLVFSCSILGSEKHNYDNLPRSEILEADNADKNWDLLEKWNPLDTVLFKVDIRYYLPKNFYLLNGIETDWMRIWAPCKELEKNKENIFKIRVNKKFEITMLCLNEIELNKIIDENFEFFNRLEYLSFESNSIDSIPSSIYRLKNLKTLGVFSNKKNINIDFNKFNQMENLKRLNTYSLTAEALCEFSNNENIKVEKIGLSTMSGFEINKKCYLDEGRKIVIDVNSFQCDGFWR